MISLSSRIYPKTIHKNLKIAKKLQISRDINSLYIQTVNVNLIILSS